MDAVTGEIFGGLCAQLHGIKRTHAHRVQDLWLAAQAIQHGVKLLTHNGKDFRDIAGLDLVIWREAAAPR